MGSQKKYLEHSGRTFFGQGTFVGLGDILSDKRTFFGQGTFVGLGDIFVGQGDIFDGQGDIYRVTKIKIFISNSHSSEATDVPRRMRTG